ncbi:MAG: universal stress protein [Wenzhouxiangella sp.]|nr:universal stress protein [Wenzhouxiangella sp.]
MGKTTDNGRSGGMTPTRVVVLLDASPDALRALEVAAELARRHDVPLLAVTVEETDRLRSAAFSFASEVGAASGAIRPVDEALLSRRRERLPVGIRRVVERVAGSDGISWRLVVARGRLVEEVLALSEPGDVLMLGRVGWSSRLGRRLGTAPLVLARRAMGSVQICSARPVRERGRIAVLVEHPAAAQPLLGLAAERARRAGRELVLLLPASVDVDPERLAAELGRRPPAWRSRLLQSFATGEMLRALAEEGAVELLVGRSGAWLESPAAARLLAHWQMPLLVVGAPARDQSRTSSPAGSRRL